MTHDEFEKAFEDIEIRKVIHDILDVSRTASIQLRNVEDMYKSFNITGIHPSTISGMNKDNYIMYNVLKSLYVLVDHLDVVDMKILIRKLLVEYEHGNIEFEEK